MTKASGGVAAVAGQISAMQKGGRGGLPPSSLYEMLEVRAVTASARSGRFASDVDVDAVRERSQSARKLGVELIEQMDSALKAAEGARRAPLGFFAR
jgi:hypothetical protein